MRRQWLITVLVSVVLAACSGGTATDPGSAPPKTTDPATPTPSANTPSVEPTTAASSGLNGVRVETYRGNAARTGVMPGPGPAGTPQVAWQFAAGGPFGSSPVVRDGVVYAVSGDGVVHAIDLATGVERWSVALGSEASALRCSSVTFWSSPMEQESSGHSEPPTETSVDRPDGRGDQRLAGGRGRRDRRGHASRDRLRA